MRHQHLYTIGEASRLTGLSAHAIRVWERRYNAVKPRRSNGNQRLYSGVDVERLHLLKAWVAAGHRISKVAGRSNRQLRSIHQPFQKDASGGMSGSAVDRFVERGLDAAAALDEAALLKIFASADAKLSRPLMLDGVMGTLANRIGEKWAAGNLRVVQEHVATSAMQTYLRRLIVETPQVPTAPVLIAGTPRGQRCELGALMATAMALTQGWRATFIGADLAPDDIAVSAEVTGADAVALSIACTANGKTLDKDLIELRRLLPEPISIWVGGGEAASAAAALARIKASIVNSMVEWTAALAQQTTQFPTPPFETKSG